MNRIVTMINIVSHAVLLAIIAALAVRLYATPEPHTTVTVEYVVGDGVLFEAVPVP